MLHVLGLRQQRKWNEDGRAEKSFTGTSGVCRFAKPAPEFMERILKEGLEHHVALAYGDHAATLRALAKLLDLPVLEL